MVTMRPRSIVLGLIAVLALLAMVSALSAAALMRQDAASSPPDEEPAHSVRLIVDYGDGVQTVFTALEWSKGMTALDALRQASEHPHGVALKYRGHGETAFVEKIADLENEGGGARSRNWLYRVNGATAKQGAGITRLAPDDVVLWKFTARTDTN